MRSSSNALEAFEQTVTDETPLLAFLDRRGIVLRDAADRRDPRRREGARILSALDHLHPRGASIVVLR
jgi:hypothetical protein